MHLELIERLEKVIVDFEKLHDFVTGESTKNPTNRKLYTHVISHLTRISYLLDNVKIATEALYNSKELNAPKKVMIKK